MSARKDAQTATLRHGQAVELLTQIKAAVAVSNQADPAQLVELQSDLDVARMTVSLLGAELEDADEARDRLTADLMARSADNDRLLSGHEILVARAEAAENDLIECRLDLNNAENKLSQEQALTEKLEGDLDRALADVERLKKAVPPSATITSEGMAVTLTPVAELVRDLAIRGYSDAGIHSIVNARMEPKDWLNVAGVRAIREMVVPS